MTSRLRWPRARRYAGRRAALAVLLFLLPAPLSAQQQTALDPTLRELVRPVMLDAVRRDIAIGRAAMRDVPSWTGSLSIHTTTGEPEPRVGVFLRVRSQAALDELRAAGAEIGSVVEDMITARVPLSALESIGALANVQRVEAARSLRVEHDSSMKAIHVEELRARTEGAWIGSTGRGVIVGVYDTGIDLTHDDFVDDARNTRMLGLWDQTLSGTPPVGFTRGHYCSPASIQAAINATSGACQQRDFHGHGTHTAGTAAGDGSDGDEPYKYAGVAPEADLLIVNGGPGIFFEDLIIDGLTWMRQEGLRLGRPIVVNLSLGGQFGAHDGSRIYEKMIDALSGPGFIIVISAGNQGVNRNTTPLLDGRLIHARGTPIGTQAGLFEFDVPTYVQNGNPCTGNFMNLSLWYEASDDLRIEVERPSGTSAGANRGTITTADDVNGRIMIDNGASGPDEENGDIEVSIAINGCGTSGIPEAGRWKIRVVPQQTGSGQPYDMWITASGGAQPNGMTGFDNRFIVGSPGNARRAITVGAFVTRLCWPSIATAGQICYTQREEPGDLARFSSAGPTRDGRLKPEITAPGLGVMSALSSVSNISQQRVAPDAVHAVREGTSMAAPHVAGTIALLLQVNPGLTPEDVKAALSASAVSDAFTALTYDAVAGGRPEDWWGWGKLNARDALLSLGDGAPATLSIATSSAVLPSDVIAERGTRLPLLRLGFEARGPEAIDVLAIGFDVTGRDVGARLLLVRDADGDGVDAEDPVVGSAPAPLNSATLRIVVTPDSLRVFPFGETPVYAVVEMSGQAPNGAVFQATLVPATIQTVGVRSGERDRLDPAIAAVESGPAETTVLESEQLLSFSANPVREGSVVFNFVEAPTTAAVYTLTGRRVTDLCARDGMPCGTGSAGEGSRVAWDLTNDQGTRVAPGVYLVIFRVSGETFREKLMILTPGSVPDVPQ